MGNTRREFLQNVTVCAVLLTAVAVRVPRRTRAVAPSRGSGCPRQRPGVTYCDPPRRLV
jgi:hypothetical protein